jgi:thymidylate kinase
MVKFILCEGIDRVGKDTQIKELLPKLVNNPTQVFHYSSIKGLSKQESKKYSKMLYTDMFKIMKQSFSGDKRNLIFNRAHLGEFVYGPLYRKYKGDYIFNIEKKFEKYDFWDSVYLITFIDTPENLIAREDGDSFSIDPKMKQKEIDLFKEATEKSLIKNKMIMNINGKSIEQVHNEICIFLGVSR